MPYRPGHGYTNDEFERGYEAKRDDPFASRYGSYDYEQGFRAREDDEYRERREREEREEERYREEMEQRRALEAAEQARQQEEYEYYLAMKMEREMDERPDPQEKNPEEIKGDSDE